MKIRRSPRETRQQSTAVAYLRVSTDEQKNGPEAQRATIEAWAAREGVQVLAWHVDEGVSGGAPLDERPALLEAMAAAKGGVRLVVSSRDRLARDVFMAALISQKCDVVSADGTANGNSPEAAMMRRMLDAFAEYERALIKARTRKALRVKKERGELTGTAPYGLQVGADGVHLEPSDVEQRIIGRALALNAEGLTIRAITERLNSEGHRNRAGRTWAFQGVYSFLRPLLENAA